MLERLMNTDVYDRDSNTKSFNAKYVTQLVRNYRSHETILHVSNELFYENALQVHAIKCKSNLSLHIISILNFSPLFLANTDWFLNSRILSAPQFPFIFHSVRGHAIKLPKETRYKIQIQFKCNTKLNI